MQWLVCVCVSVRTRQQRKSLQTADVRTKYWHETLWPTARFYQQPVDEITNVPYTFL